MTEKEQEIQVESAVAGLLEKVNNTSLDNNMLTANRFVKRLDRSMQAGKALLAGD